MELRRLRQHARCTGTEIDLHEVRDALERLTANASRELLVKQPHWGDAILCDGLLYAAQVLKSDAPVEAAQRWFEPKLAAGPRTNGWFWFWAAEALPALDLYLETKDPSLPGICARDRQLHGKFSRANCRWRVRAASAGARSVDRRLLLHGACTRAARPNLGQQRRCSSVPRIR